MTKDVTVDLALVGVIASCVAALVWVVKYSNKELKKALCDHAKANERQAASNEKVAEVNQEMLVFMKSLNGKLAKATIQTAKEANK